MQQPVRIKNEFIADENVRWKRFFRKKTNSKDTHTKQVGRVLLDTIILDLDVNTVIIQTLTGSEERTYVKVMVRWKGQRFSLTKHFNTWNVDGEFRSPNNFSAMPLRGKFEISFEEAIIMSKLLDDFKLSESAYKFKKIKDSQTPQGVAHREKKAHMIKTHTVLEKMKMSVAARHMLSTKGKLPELKGVNPLPLITSFLNQSFDKFTKKRR